MATILLSVFTAQCFGLTVIGRPIETKPLQIYGKPLHGGAINWTQSGIESPSAQEYRVNLFALRLKAMRKVCRLFSKHTPCACHETMTNSKVLIHGVEYVLEYPEFGCNEPENQKRFVGFYCR